MENCQQSWTTNSILLSEVKNWIAFSFPQYSNVYGPTKIHQQSKWGIVTEFMLQDVKNTNRINSQKPVIFKANFNTICTDIGAIYKLLSQNCRESVPILLATKNKVNEQWMLFELFNGKRVLSSNTLDTSISLVQTLASVQTTIAEVTEEEREKIPHLNLEKIPNYFNDLLEDVKTKYLKLWINPERNLMNHYKIPINIIDRLEEIKPRIQDWVNELLQEKWPDTINHTDLHGNNAIIKNDGHVLIYDWDEAMVGCPFFSLYRLMIHFRLQNPKHSTTTCFPTNMNENEIAIRDAYINAIPWKDIRKRRRAFEVARYLSPVLYMKKDCRTLEQLGLDPTEMLAGSIGYAISIWDSADKF